jgi:adenylate kinase family enzyme
MNNHRIMIFGRPGNGKSTFALKLHKQTRIPLYHLDKYFYISDWVERNYFDFLEDQQHLVDQDQWIIDGNFTRSLFMRFERATTIIYFNYPRRLCYWRVFKRLFTKDPHINDRAEGCRETMRWSLLKYMWSFETRVAGQIKACKFFYPQVAFYEIRNKKEYKIMLKMLFAKLNY